MKTTKGRWMRIFSLLVIILFVNLPIVSALEISNVRADSITETSAVVNWETDSNADSFVNYGQSKDNLVSIGDASQLMSHALPLSGLSSDTTYYFSVESNSFVSDNGGDLYSFKTAAPDTEAPQITAVIPEFIQGSRLDITGNVETGSQVRLFVNGIFLQTASSVAGKFTFQGVLLKADQENIISLEATDPAGNSMSLSGTVFADTSAPKITLPVIPEFSDSNSFQLKASLSENSMIEIFNGDKSVSKTEGTLIDVTISLQEGENNIKIVVSDKAGWTAEENFTILSDTKPPTITFDLTKGTEYYEGRAETDVTGKTEAGASVYLYVFRSFGDEYKADFKRAYAKTIADENGEFKFSEVSFPPPPFTSITELAPREVPAGLQEVLISPLGLIGNEQRKGYKVYLVAEDKSGKTAYAQKQININTCFSAASDFIIDEQIQFHAPFRLDPSLMEEGREAIQAVFNLSYRGDAIAPINTATNQPQEAFRIQSVTFQKACTQAMLDEDEFKYGCQLLPSSLRYQANGDKSAYYVTANLNRALDFIDKEDNVWDDFQKRELKMPVKVIVNYQERDAQGGWEQQKTQTSCYDLGYFVDVPIESENLIPDFLAEEGVDALNFTIEQIENVKPYLKTAMIVSGVSCIGSFLVKLIARLYRNFMANFEPWLTRIKGEDERCPNIAGQNKLYLDSTIQQWQDLKNHPEANGKSGIPDLDAEKNSLSKRCPQTASAWEVETYIDLAYRFTCDRFFCRSVPAAWTSKETDEKIQGVIAEQTMCTATTTCSFLEPVENCQEKLKTSVANTERARILEQEGKSFTCYLNRQNGLYYTVEGDPLQEERFIWKLVPEETINSIGTLSQPNLLAYKPEGSQNFCIATDLSCSSACKRKSGYQAVTDGYTLEKQGDKVVVAGNGGACYREDPKGDSTVLRNAGENTLRDAGGDKVAFGYTNDCFVQDQPEQLYQCVCEPSKAQAGVSLKGAREAVREVNGQTEEWVFRQDRVYAESKATAGTHYSKDRYYSGRDFSGAFGTNYALDAFKTEDFSTARVDPHNQLLGTFQSMCLPGIYARLQLLQSILMGLRNCIIEAKYTGFHDAGMCKTLFTQYVCGLIYKTISYAASSCSPLSLKDVGEDDQLSAIEAALGAGSKAIPATLDSSIQEVKSDYGNSALDQYFASGSQGFAESLCLAAFGYDFPLGMDFIQDAAYAFPTATNVIFPIAERELATFDPVKGSAVFNYNLGGTILPGCKIQSYRTSLKCIGPNDLGKAGVDCSQQSCDCLQSTGDVTAFETQKSYVIQGGTGVGGITKGQMVDLPIPSPQKVTSPFRYDHVVLELTLAQGESPDTCFDEQYRTGNGGIFYFPIQDTSPPFAVSCHVNLNNGKFECPQISAFFGGGQSYFEYPFMRCADAKTGDFVSCDQPNLFINNDPQRDQIVIKPYLNLGNEKACLRIEDERNLIQPRIIPLPDGLQGQYSPVITLGPVTENMVSGGSAATITKNTVLSDSGCGGFQNGDLNVITRSEKSVANTNLEFKYERNVEGLYKLEIGTTGVTLDPASNNNRFLVNQNNVWKGEKQFMTFQEANEAIFSYEGFRFSNVLGQPIPKVGSGGSCIYQAQFPRSNVGQTQGGLRVTAKLLQAVGDNCYEATQLIPKSDLGVNLHTENIRIQLEPVEVTVGKNLAEDFFNRNYEIVLSKAEAIAKRKSGSLEDAEALYYWVLSYVAQKDGTTKYKENIISLLDLFFKRESNQGKSDPYTEDVVKTGEYQIVEKNLCCVAKKIGTDNNYGVCEGVDCK
ncbi:MAG: hypothetical protein Q8Q01_00020 [archaeon]|nr:hypothetical protein [archaeon]